MSETLPVSSAPPRDPLALIEAAIEKGMDPDQLGKLMDLQERWEKSRAIEAFNQAMGRVQQKLPVVIKDAEANKKRYARLESINRLIKPVYTNEGFSLTFNTEPCEQAGHIQVSARLLHDAGHEKSYVSPPMPVDGKETKGGMSEIQGYGSTISYARRYLTCLIFDVTIANEDNDGAGKRITPADIEAINTLVEEIAKLDKISGTATPFALSDFLHWLGVENLGELPAAKLSMAMIQLDRERRKTQAEAKAVVEAKKKGGKA